MSMFAGEYITYDEVEANREEIEDENLYEDVGNKPEDLPLRQVRPNPEAKSPGEYSNPASPKMSEHDLYIVQMFLFIIRIYLTKGTDKAYT